MHKESSKVKVKVVGIGNSGKNTVNCLIGKDLNTVDFISIDTNAQTLSLSKANTNVQIDRQLTKGLNDNIDSCIDLKSLEEVEAKIKDILEGSDLVFITTGMGGETGTAASLIVARVARRLDCLTIGVVTKPFFFEGEERLTRAQKGVKKLEEYVDTLIVVPDEKFLSITDRSVAMLGAYKDVDNLLGMIIAGIIETCIFEKQLVGFDFTDLKTFLKDKGIASIGIGIGKGPNKEEDAASKALTSPLLEKDFNKATKGLLFVTSGEEILMDGMVKVANQIKKYANEEFDFLPNFGCNPILKDEFIVIIIAFDFE